MRQKLHSILRGQQGLSMILVLCVGALFVALSAALVYAASVLTANANRQLQQQEAYQLATSFSDVLEGELNNPDSSFAKFVNETYMTSETYGIGPYDNQSDPTDFPWTPSGDTGDGADAITITLRRRPGEDVDKLNRATEDAPLGDTIVTTSGWIGELEKRNDTSYTITDMQLDVTVTVEKGGEKFSYTVTYDRKIHYPIDYYMLDGIKETHYNWDGNSTFSSYGGNTYVIDNSGDHTIAPHYKTENAALDDTVKSTIRYIRGAKQTASQTQG